MNTIILTHSELEELLDAARTGLSMMEPYYAQANAGEAIQETIDKFEARLPYAENVVPPLVCPDCQRRFEDIGAVIQHARAKHAASPQSLKRLSNDMKPFVRMWPSQLAYLEHQQSK